MKLLIKKLRENAAVPKRATKGSAGLDLCACIDNEITISPGEIIKIPTGLAVSFDGGEYAVFIYARSGLASEYGITMANCVGVVDSDYRGELIVPLINLGKKPYTVVPNQRIAQMVISPVFMPETELTDDLSETERGAGGFGSSGI